MPNELPYTETRPWGEFRQYTAGESTTVKTIHVKAGESLSLQSHEKRSEFWVVLRGNPTITIGDLTVEAKEGDEFNVPVGTQHRIAASVADADILEISKGVFDESDIIRIDDRYGRA